AEGQLAQPVALQAYPGVAVEEHAGGVLLAGRQVELALELEDHRRPARRLRQAVRPGNAPAVAAEPGGLVPVLVIPFRVRVADAAQGGFEQPIQGDRVDGGDVEREAFSAAGDGGKQGRRGRRAGRRRVGCWRLGRGGRPGRVLRRALRSILSRARNRFLVDDL